jgi:hypothetical protein
MQARYCVADMVSCQQEMLKLPHSRDSGKTPAETGLPVVKEGL